MGLYYGTATFYDCITTPGLPCSDPNAHCTACGNACDADSILAAYPHLDGKTDRAQPCAGMDSVACEGSITVLNLCTNDINGVVVEDYGPCPGCTCRADVVPCNWNGLIANKDKAFRILDLSRAAYRGLNGDEAAGHMLIRITF